MTDASAADQLRVIRGALAAQGAVIESLVRSTSNKDVLRTAINDSLQQLERVHAFSDAKFGHDPLFEQAYQGFLKALLAKL